MGWSLELESWRGVLDWILGVEPCNTSLEGIESLISGIQFILVRKEHNKCINLLSIIKYHQAAPVAERLRTLFLNHLIISPLCLVWVRALPGHM